MWDFNTVWGIEEGVTYPYLQWQFACTCGDICVNTTGWWRDGGAFKASNTPIQHAIDNATAGNTICVKDGTYTENVDVNKRLTIRTEHGFASTTVQAANSDDHVFEITADYVNISGFTATGSTAGPPNYGAGIYLGSDADHCNISENNVSNNYYGIALNSSSNHNTLSRNTVNSNNNDGIHLFFSSSYNTLSRNTVNSNKDHGIVLKSSSNHNTLTENTANYNSHRGIYLYKSCNNNTLTSNTASHNGHGIELYSSSSNTLTSNTASHNGRYSIELDSSSNNNLTSNTVNSNKDHGIMLDGSGYNTLTSNTASHNGDKGIELDSSGNNLIYNNYFKNTHNAYDNGNNRWNITKTAGTNIIGSQYLGGNYWSDYAGMDTDGDGLGDTLLPYNSNWDIIEGGDYHPLVLVPGEELPRVHNLNTGENFSTIQAAIDAVNTTDGQTITVDPGIYNENVDVYKSLTIKSTSGNPDGTIVQANNPEEHVFAVTADYVNISGFTVTGADTWGKAGIYLDGVNHCNISHNNALNDDFGIILEYSDNNTIIGNNASSYKDGIVLEYSNSNIITDNFASKNYVGIRLFNSRNNTIIGNNASYLNALGIGLHNSGDNTLRNNLMYRNGYNFDVEGLYYSEFDNDIDTSNLVDGKPIYYLVDDSDVVIDSSSNAGTVYCINCDNVTVKDLNITNNGKGICFYNASNSRIEDNHIDTCYLSSIGLFNSMNNSIGGNTVNNTGTNGIYLGGSTDNTITGNDVHYSVQNNIVLENSGNNTITGNNASFGYSGIYLKGSDNNTITNNTASNSYVLDGISLEGSDNNTITDNTASNNLRDGISLEDSSNNTITGNTATSNNKYGICLDFSNNNLIYNNYFNNTDNAWDDGTNIWNITKTFGTNIIGGAYLGGNYWSDYAGEDLDGDGLGDTQIPYNSTGNIASGGDYLPFVPVQKPTVSITTDKFIYKTGDTMTISIDIYNPTENIVTFQWYWGVPQSDIWLLVTSVPIPAGYKDTTNISFSIPNWGSTPFGSVFYVQLLDASGEVLEADVAWWAYSPGRFMGAMSVDLSKEIAKIIEKVELPT